MRKITKQPDGSIVLYPLTGQENVTTATPGPEDKLAIVISLKTTGLDFLVDEIIELSYIKFTVNKEGRVTQYLK